MESDIRPLTTEEREEVNRLMDADHARRSSGIYEKYRVERTDGSSEPGGKHHGCRYFVLDMDHDSHAVAALAAYAASCQDKYPVLAKELSEWVFRNIPHRIATLEAEKAFRFKEPRDAQ